MGNDRARAKSNLYRESSNVENDYKQPEIKCPYISASSSKHVGSYYSKKKWAMTFCEKKLADASSLPPCRRSNNKKNLSHPNITIIKFPNSLKGFGICSKAGRNDDRSSKSNQDSYFHILDFLKTKNIHLFGITDGHGDYGKTLATLIGKYFPLNLEKLHRDSLSKNLGLFHDNIVRWNIVLDTFAKTQDDIVSENKDDSQESGSTATIILLLGKTLLCANVGDSRAILGSRLPNSKWQVLPLSKDHRPNNPIEYERITKSNGQVNPCLSNC